MITFEGVEWLFASGKVCHSFLFVYYQLPSTTSILESFFFFSFSHHENLSYSYHPLLGYG